MAGFALLDAMPVQDRDLLTRLTLYFEALETRLAQGQGWFIFNARGQRAAWLSRFIHARLAEYRPLISFYVMPWRDFALNAYMTEIELPGHQAAAPPASGHDADDGAHRRREYTIATGVSRATGFQMRQCDVLVVTGLQPSQPHEVRLLDATLGQRHLHRRATLLLTPHPPDELARRVRAIDGGASAWERLWATMYERSLLAL
ncbi:MAG: hypothetical protein IT340_00160 [Chloroflexi bacterium]|nr:hypothetical protein [Chloroflexota bacterium]